MAKQTDIKINVSSLSGVTPVGVTITYAVGAIPTAVIDLAPGPPSKLKIDNVSAEVIKNTDKLKRRNDINVDVEVDTYTGDGGRKNRKLRFVGLLDGLSLNNVVGNNSYQAIIKSKAQILLELTTVTPGLYPTSVNIYKNPSMAIGYKQGGEENDAVKGWYNIQATQKLAGFAKDGPVKYYTELIKLIIDIQLNNPFKFAGNQKLANGSKALEKVLQDRRYKRALQRAKEIVDKIEVDAVDGGKMKEIVAGHPLVLSQISKAFTEGSNLLLENYLGFLQIMGCSIIFGNEKAWVVPVNSVIKQDGNSPGKGQLQSKPNQCGPADYSSYSYNDNGYRDIAAVLITAVGHVDGLYLGGIAFDHGIIGEYMDDQQVSEASGVLVIKQHPFMLIHPNAPANSDSQDAKTRLDNKGDSMMKQPLKYSQAKSQAQQDYKSQYDKKKQDVKKLNSEIPKNYAEIKLYQNRYGDRTGSIMMDFNPQWCPGTGGSLYIRESKIRIDFYVTSVTHRIDVSSPNTGTAMTTVNFSCGRIGSSPAGVSNDKFLGYDKGKEKQVQDGFVQDIQ